MGVAVLTSKINDSTAICRKLLEETLKQRRYSEYVEFADTVGLLQSLDCCRYGTVILRDDISNMLETAQKIRSKHPKTRIVFLTDHDELHARDCGMPADFCAPAYPDANQITRLIENLFVKETAAN